MDMKPVSAILILLLTCCLALVSTAGAGQQVVVAINDTPPWKMMVGGKADGIDIAITDLLLSRLGLQPVYLMMPFKRCLLSLENGQADLMGFLAFKTERSRFLKYLNPPYQGDVKIFYVRKGEAARLTSYLRFHWEKTVFSPFHGILPAWNASPNLKLY
jgi:polar amino acid transport system substrate-binding protein